MTDATDRSGEERVLVLAPTEGDAALCQTILVAAGVDSYVCRNVGDLCRELDQGAGALLLTEEAVPVSEASDLVQALRGQPEWSDLPLIVLAGRGADSPAAVWAMEVLGNVTFQERPVRVTTLVSVLRAALKSRRRQYELRDRLEALREADRQKDEFLATLAHELRNPLAPIRNALHILRISGSDRGDSRRIREMMERQVNHMVRLVDDLLEVSRITRGKIELRKERVELKAIVDSAVETSRPLIEAGSHQLTITVPAEPLTLDADPVRLAQVIANLLNNAAKYTEDGGRIWLTARREGSEAVVSVRDNGLGIPPEMLPNVFEMFAQSHRSLERARGGLGIGLTLARNLVELHGGRIEARSDGPGRGSEFTLRLSLAETRPDVGEGQPLARGKQPTGLSACRVLVVDDNRDSADSLAMLLNFAGALADVVYDGPGALEAIRKYRPAVVLLDVGMPQMDGHEVARRVRQEPEFRDLMLIAMTGWGQEDDRRRSRESGFDHHLVKPVDIGTLQALLASMQVPEGRPLTGR